MVTLNKVRQIISEREESKSVFGSIDDVFRNFNTGLARTFGIPRAITDITGKFRDFQFETFGIEAKETPGILPTGAQIQELGSRVGMTFAPGEEPDTITARTLQNIGAAAPILAALPLTLPILGIEAAASFAAAAGGKALEQTEFGQKQPELARGIGELGGGFGTVFAIPLAKLIAKNPGAIISIFKFIKKILPRSEKRALKRLGDQVTDPQEALRELERATGVPEGELLTTAQATGSRGIAGLEKAVVDEVPKVAAIIEKTRIQSVNQLQKQFSRTGDIADARLLIEEKLVLRAERAEKALSRIDKVSDPTVLSTRAENILSEALTEGNKVITKAWANLPKTIKGKGDNVNAVIIKEYKNIRERGKIDPLDIKRISFVARSKLGTLNKEGKLTGGTLFSKQGNASAKAIHRFYSDLGSEVEKLGRFGGQGNKIRIINKLREALLKDLDAVGAGGQYRETIKLTREFHDKFTKGTVGRILGRARGETPSPVTALEDIVGQGGVTAKENILQALKVSPQMKTQIEDFLKVRFVMIAKNETNNKINVNAGNAFIKKFDNILDDIFPELKRDFKDAIAKQADVDEFIGVPQVSGLSPLAREKTAAGFFLGREPGEEMAALLRSKTIRTDFLTDLVKLTRSDASGKAFKGLQNGFTEELLKVGNIDDFAKLSGTKMLNRLNELEKSIVNSKLFSAEEFGRLKEIAKTSKKMEQVRNVPIPKGGIISDALGIIIALPGRFIGARIGGRAGQDMGSSLVLASAGSKTTTDFLKRFTNDEAKEILIRFVTDKALAKDMLTKLTKLNQQQQGSLVFRLARKVDEFGIKAIESIPRPPITAVAPAAGSFAESISINEEREQKFNTIKTLLEQRRN